MDGRTDGQTDRQMDGQTDRHRLADSPSSVNSTIHLSEKKKYIFNLSKKKQILDLGLCAHRM
jgi:hypothetical protein